MRLRSLCGAALAGALAASLALAACDDSSAVKETLPDAGPSTAPDATATPDGGPGADGGPTDCFTNPQSHEEIINACTDAVKIAKNPTLPLLYPDGGLPPLP